MKGRILGVSRLAKGWRVGGVMVRAAMTKDPRLKCLCSCWWFVLGVAALSGERAVYARRVDREIES